MRLVCVLLACSSVSAQELGELSAERPGFTASSGMVGMGVLQLEQGYMFESAGESGSRLATFSGPQAAARFGVAGALEFRFSTNGYAWQTEEFGLTRSAVSGPNDYVVGVKVRALSQGATRPEVSITGGVSLPVRGSPFTSSGHDPSFTLAAYKDLPDKFSVAANANMASISDSRGRFFSSGQSLWSARSVGAGVSIFVEAFRTTLGRVEGSQTALDIGMFRGLGKHAQIDLAAGHSVAGARPAWFITMGCVLRVPHALLR